MNISKPSDSEAELLGRLYQSLEGTMPELMERYTSLVRSTVERFLDDPEDVKECVNDTFMEFFRAKDQFDQEKGSLSSYLVGIAKNLAISRFRKNAARPTSELPEDVIDGGDPIGDAERQADLQQAINQLSSDEAELIRMKYYEGKTLQEVADAQGLPHETVKKRHQRSLSKLRVLLITGLGILLAALLAACAYLVLRGFGVLPGYGMSTTPDIPVYLLAEKSSVQCEHWTYIVREAEMLEDSLRIDIVIRFEDDDAQEQWRAMYEQCEADNNLKYELSGLDQSGPVPIIWYETRFTTTEENETALFLFLYEIGPELGGIEDLELTVSLFEVDIPFVLHRTPADSPEDYSYALSEQGGVLAIPNRSGGVLSVELYPLNTGTYQVTPDLIWGAYRQGRIGDITVTGKDREPIVGRMAYTPFSDRFSVWEFDAAEPGEYVLHIPYVYLEYDIPFGEPYTIDLDLEACRWEDGPVELPFGTMRILSCQKSDLELQPGDLGWTVIVQLNTELEVNAPPLRVMSDENLLSKTCDTLPNNCFKLRVYMPEGEVDLSRTQLTLSGTVCMLWNHEFEIPFMAE